VAGGLGGKEKEGKRNRKWDFHYPENKINS